ncbi:MAG: hypothetical protein JRJ49_04780 [Deltaproteobacteria bacterium]|nr:hypothetical protein [Deltaproteobacteria bacterium]
MKILGIISNSLLLIIGVVVLIDKHYHIETIVTALAMIFAGSINLYFVLQQNGNDLITLYLKRRAAEEKSKLNKILSE